jgi:hypothetical protein
MKKTVSLILVFIFCLSSLVRADEGMWIPLLLHKYNIKDMQSKGFKLTAEDIYSINHASMKDAVFIFGGGCTGELISDQGLIITNHHCGFGRIQSHSSLEHDYLTDGFWAMKKEQELPNPGLIVTFLERMEDVTLNILANVNDNMGEAERQFEIQKQIQQIELQASEGGKYKAVVKPFFYGNEYYLFVTKIYTDVRLVGAPPSSIGKFGGDTDNWMWPRHTGDFSLFRIYADKNNNPAVYSTENVPYKPKKHFPISIKGVQKGDFTMVLGYPGSTQEYLTSYAVKMISEIQNPNRIEIRQNILNIMEKYMNKDAGIRIKYANKYWGASNYWKKWIGENNGLKRLNTISKKEDYEKNITSWINSNEETRLKYGQLLSDYEKIYKELSPYQLADEYFYEAIYCLDIFKLANSFKGLSELKKESKQENIDKLTNNLKKTVENHFKDYDLALDKELFLKMITLYIKNLDKQFHPEEFKIIESKFKGNIDKYIDYLYKKSMFTDKTTLLNYLNIYKPELNSKLEQDPIFKLFNEFIEVLRNKILPVSETSEYKLSKLNRLYMQAIMKFEKDKLLYPDANFSLRLSYGKVDNYMPSDGVKYLHYTTLKGIIEKDNPEIYDYKVPAKLKELYEKKDYGEYAENGEMHVCFTASNHTTGGNSGSPVINGDGYLIGVNFDRNWEGTMSDIMYDPDMCRNISLDIRYALFIIDKFAGAKYLIDEMTIIR